MAKRTHKRRRLSSASQRTSAEALPPAVSPPTGPPSQTPSEHSVTETGASKKATFEKRFSAKNRSNEEVLAEQMKTWKSRVYDHFKTPEIIVVDGEVKYKFICKYHPTMSPIVRTRHDDSTSNLVRHFNTCTGTPGDNNTIDDFAQGATYSVARFRFKLAMWIARRYRPFEIVNDPELRELFTMLYGRVDIPSPQTVSRDIQEIRELAEAHVRNILTQYPGKIHLSVDGWTSPNVLSFLGVTVHFLDDKKLQHFILDYIKLTKGHTGVYLGEKLKETLTRFGINHKILGITADNASNNDVMVSELESLGGINGSHTQIRCFAHILNLVLKAILSAFRRTKASGAGVDASEAALAAELLEGLTNVPENSNEGSDDDFELDADRESSDDETIEDIIMEMEREDALSSAEERIGRCAVTKLTALAKRMFHSPTIREDFKNACSSVKIEHHEMKRAVDTRWNSLAECVQRALSLRPAIERLVSMAKYDKDGDQGLRRYKESDEEWTLLEQLHPLLQIFLKVTKRVSQSDTPLLYEVIPLIDFVTTRLEDFIGDSNNHRVIRVAAARGLRVLNRYYSKTDDSIMYRAAMIFHPRMKTEYFRRHGWEESWISTAVNLVRDQWRQHYQPSVLETERNGATHETDDMFAEIDDFNRESSGDALEDYLNEGPIKTCTDPIAHWVSESTSTSPGSAALSRMALDFLTAPAASTDMERGFSRGGLTVSKRRHNLSDGSVRSATVVGSWSDIPGLIPEDEILKVFKDKSKRSKATGAATSLQHTDTIVVDSDSSSGSESESA